MTTYTLREIDHATDGAPLHVVLQDGRIVTDLVLWPDASAYIAHRIGPGDTYREESLTGRTTVQDYAGWLRDRGRLEEADRAEAERRTK